MENIEKFRLSVSKLKTFIDCSAKYNFAYVQKLPKKDRDYHVFGKFVHKVLEDFHRYYINGGNDKYNIIMSNSFKNALNEFKVSDAQKKEAWDYIYAYLKTIYAADPSYIKNVLAVEKEFSLSLSDNLVVIGFIDRIQLDQDGVLHVVDYKTTKNKSFLKNDFFQLLTYAYALCLEDPSLTKVRGSYVLIKHNFEYVTKDFSLEEIKAVKDYYTMYSKKISEEKLWRPNITKLCEYCDYLDVCEGYKKSKKTNEIDW